jgi:hypothetical protein
MSIHVKPDDWVLAHRTWPGPSGGPGVEEFQAWNVEIPGVPRYRAEDVCHSRGGEGHGLIGLGSRTVPDKTLVSSLDGSAFEIA